MRTTSSFAFYVRKSKTDRNGYAPLECSVTICGQRKFINLPMKFKPEEFNRKKPSSEIVEAVDLWRARITQYQIQMLREGMVITAESLREVVKSGGVHAYDVNTLFRDYLSILRRRVGVDLKESVYRKYELVYERFLEYLSGDSDVTRITPHLIQTIAADWRAKYDPSTAASYLTRLKTFTKYACDNGKLQINPFQGIRISRPVKPIKALTEEEVMNLLGMSLEPRLQRVLDLWLIQAATGMSYSDLMNFSIDDIKTEGGIRYISKPRKKTGKVFTAAIFPFALPIIEHYRTLPRISNQKFNKYLKEIDPRLTTHMGRRTYATMLVNKGVDMDVVASALGDNVQIAARYYARIYTNTLVQRQGEKMVQK